MESAQVPANLARAAIDLVSGRFAIWLGVITLVVFIAIGGWLALRPQPPDDGVPPIGERQDQQPRDSRTDNRHTRVARGETAASAATVAALSSQRGTGHTGHVAKIRVRNRQKLEFASWREQLASAGVHLTSPVPDSAQFLDASPDDTQAIWNYWIGPSDDGHGPQPVPEGLRISKKARVTFELSVLDLSSLFAAVQATPVSKPFLSTLGTASRDGTDSMAVDVLIFPADEHRLLIDAEQRHQLLKVDLRPLETVSREARPNVSDPAFVAYNLKSRVAQFGFDVVALTDQPQQVGIVFVDSTSGFPLQTMTLTLEPDVDARKALRVMESGHANFSDQSSPYDLSLELHDFGIKPDGDPFPLHATLIYADKATGRYAYVSWIAQVSLQGLKDGARTYKKNLGDQGSGKHLENAGLALGNLLFDPVPAKSPGAELAADENVTNAEFAKHVLMAAAKYGDDRLPPSMAVRITRSGPDGAKINVTDVIPFGAMGIGDGDEVDENTLFLGRRIAIGLLLANAHFPGGDVCPNNWYFALPRPSEELGSPIQDALTDLAPALVDWPESATQRQSIELDELRKWIGKRGNGSPDDTFVFAYLGHHDQGHLFLRSGASLGLAPGEMRRLFQGTSIAILDACTSAMDEVSDGTPVGMLQTHGVASVIATSSEVSGHLAAAYLDCIDRVLQKRDKLTVGQANVLATQCLWSKGDGKRWGGKYSYDAAALKYMLIGNPQQSICSPMKGNDK